MDYLPFCRLKRPTGTGCRHGRNCRSQNRVLQRAGAQVRVVEEADFDESQIDSVVLVIAATENRELNRRVSDAAQARYRLVNVVDDQPLCSFISRRSLIARRCWWRSPPAAPRQCWRACCGKDRSAAADQPRAHGGESQLLAQPFKTA